MGSCEDLLQKGGVDLINISGHLRNERRIIGYQDMENPITVNCCGQQVFKTKDYSQQRTGGRLDYQIIYIYKGAGHFYVDNQWIDLAAGNIILFRPSEPQVYSYFASEKPEIYWIHFTGTDCERLLAKYNIDNCYIGENMALKLLFQDITMELQLKKHLYEDMVLSNFYQILTTICRTRQEMLAPCENNFSIDRLIIELNQNYARDWNVPVMADFCKLSESHFAHMFKLRTGAAPMHYLNALRIEKSKELLTSDSMAVSAVARLVGFPDPLYFSRVFKKYTGVTPQKFYQTTLDTNTPEWYQVN